MLLLCSKKSSKRCICMRNSLVNVCYSLRFLFVFASSILLAITKQLFLLTDPMKHYVHIHMRNATNTDRMLTGFLPRQTECRSRVSETPPNATEMDVESVRLKANECVGRVVRLLTMKLMISRSRRMPDRRWTSRYDIEPYKCMPLRLQITHIFRFKVLSARLFYLFTHSLTHSIRFTYTISLFVANSLRFFVFTRLSCRRNRRRQRRQQ